MKNIHLIPTEKPSILIQKRITKELKLSSLNNPQRWSNVNIYITSEEEIKEGDWFTDSNNSLKISYKLSHVQFANPKKIILTDDPDLLDDGVQAIDDDFLEWLVKNPSCEWVEVRFDYKKFRWSDLNKSQCYKIIIPQEEPKPHSFCETPEEKCTMNYCDENGCQNRVRHLVEPQEELKQDLEKEMFELEQELDIPSNLRWHNSKPKQEIIATEEDAKIFVDTLENPPAPNEKLKTAFGKQPKQETLEEAGDRELSYINDVFSKNIDFVSGFRLGMLLGAKWQQEQDKSKYSEGDMISFATFYYTHQGKATEYWGKDLFKEWFEQFKKK